MRIADIELWVDAAQTINQNTSAYEDKNARRPTKRRRTSDLTPPPSMDSPSDHDASACKRPLDDETPKAKRRRPASNRASSSYSASDQASMSPSSSSARSGRISPLKQMLLLRHDPRGLEMRELLQFRAMPPDLVTFLNKIKGFARGKGIISSSMKEMLVNAAKEEDYFSWALCNDDDTYWTDDPAVEGCTPMPSDVLEAVEAAVECNTKNHPEATWNMEVHYLILRMALRPVNHRRFNQLVNFMASTTATIIPNYGNPTASKKVDFCMYIEPQNDTPQPATNEYRAAMEALRRALPEYMVSFTDFMPLDDRHVALGIETKKPGENSEAGKLQLGVWQMARWNFLRRLAGPDDGVSATTAGQPLPTFLPGIITLGHEWYLVITTVEGNKTVLWQKSIIGSTSDTMGVYQIVRTLQYIAQWAREVHWPYLRSLIASHCPVEDAVHS